jgi:hypothetical protein
VKTSDVLRAAKALIDSPEKWWKPGRDGNHGQHCALVAICRAGGLAAELGAIDAFARVVESPTGVSYGFRIPAWNNARDRTHADVMAAFDRAIAAQELEEAFAAPSVSEPFVEVHA